MLSRRAVQQAFTRSAAERAANGIAAERKRQPGCIAPPLAHVDARGAVRLWSIGELAFVDDESGFVLAFEYLGNDLVEGDDLGDWMSGANS